MKRSPKTGVEHLNQQKRLPKLSDNTVLLIEDEALVADTVQKLLEHLGWQVRIAASGKAALAYLKKSNPQPFMVLMDMNLPDMHGSLLFEKMGRINSNLKVFICSGCGQDEEVHRLITGGARGFLQKPFGLQSLEMVLTGNLPTELEIA